MSSYKHPPQLDEKDYTQWKNEVELWEMLTDMDKKKQGLAIALSLTGKARELATSIDREKLTSEEGVKHVLNELDKLFEKERTFLMYDAYMKFSNFKKTESMSMLDYVVEFEQLNKKCINLKIDSDAVLALKLLFNANLSEQQQQMALTACSNMKYEEMKNVLTRIFSKSPSATVFVENEREIKEEIMLTGNQNTRGRGSYRGYSSGRGRGRVSRGGTSRRNEEVKMNPSYNGTVSRCAVCDSKCHWAKDCPHSTQNVNVLEDLKESSINEEENVNMTLMTKVIDNELTNQEILVIESQNAAIVDTACTKTVCGSEWLRSFLDTLSPEDLKDVVYKDSSVPFKFGDGRVVTSYQCVIFPAKIGNSLCNIQTEVVDCKIPLLLSKESLAKAEAVIDIGKVKEDFTKGGRKIMIGINVVRNDFTGKEA